MHFTTENEPDTSLPEDSIHRARLEEIKLRTFEWTDRDGEKREGQSLDWWWEITQSALGPQYIGRKVKGECKAKLTNRDDNRFRQWSEVLLGREIPIGMSIDTDDLIGLEAEIVIGIRTDRRDPSKKFPFVSDVAPADTTGDDIPF
jgi:hypothetical protein